MQFYWQVKTQLHSIKVQQYLWRESSSGSIPLAGWNTSLNWIKIPGGGCDKYKYK
jgi:hypothetical protein